MRSVNEEVKSFSKFLPVMSLSFSLPFSLFCRPLLTLKSGASRVKEAMKVRRSSDVLVYLKYLGTAGCIMILFIEESVQMI